MMESLTLHHLLEITFGLLGAITGGIVFFLALRIAPTLTLSSHQRVLRILAVISLLIVVSELIGVVTPFFRESALIYVFEELVELVLIVFGAIVLYFVGYAELKEIAPLRQSSEVDDLTGLSSRSYFRRAAMRRMEFSQANNLPLTCIVLNVDDFKEYNDRHGHGAGDEALRGVSRALRKSARADDLVARHGGEEFVLPRRRRVRATYGWRPRRRFGCCRTRPSQGGRRMHTRRRCLPTWQHNGFLGRGLPKRRDIHPGSASRGCRWRNVPVQEVGKEPNKCDEILARYLREGAGGGVMGWGVDGLYWLVVGMVLSFLVAVGDACVLLVEIKR
jgi:GGDEF domain-containing protein